MWLLDAGRHVDALDRLRAATDAGATDPVVWRNLAIALVSADGDDEAADAALVHALELRDDARLVFERDVLAVRRGLGPWERLALLERHRHLLAERDDLAVRWANLLLDVGRVDAAWTLLTTRRFRPFEGGEGLVIAAFDRASCALAERLLPEAPAEAAALLESGFVPPMTLGEGRHPAEHPVQRWVLLGRARAAMGDADGAAAAWRAAVASTPLAVAPRPADARTFWEGVAFVSLGEESAAEVVWRALDARAAELRAAPDAVDYFATSVPELTLFDSGTAAVRAAEADELERLARGGGCWWPRGERTTTADRLDGPASVAQWKSSCVLSKRLGVRVPPGAPFFCALIWCFTEVRPHRFRLLPTFCPHFLGSRHREVPVPGVYQGAPLVGCCGWPISVPEQFAQYARRPVGTLRDVGKAIALVETLRLPATASRSSSKRSAYVSSVIAAGVTEHPLHRFHVRAGADRE